MRAMKAMKRRRSAVKDLVSRVSAAAASALILMIALTVVSEAQTGRRNRNPIVRPAATPTPKIEPEIISRANDFPDDDAERPVQQTDIASGRANGDTNSAQLIERLEARIRQLEAQRGSDPDAVQKRLMLNLDILTRAEQRSESLRKQIFEMIEKENAIQMRLDSIEFDIRPEMIERSVATAGSLRPEEVRESRRRQLAAERTNLQNLLAEVQRNKTNLETGIKKADELVERLRLRLDKEIDEALADGTEQKPDN